MDRNIQLYDIDGDLFPKSKSSGIQLDGLPTLPKDVGCFKKGTDINGMSLNDLIEEGLLGIKKQLKFLQTSDDHKRTESIQLMSSILSQDDSYDFGIITGDMELTSPMKDIISNNNKILVMLGNHDVNQTAEGNQKFARDNFIAPYMTKRGIMGDDEKIGSWWYRDFGLFRIIAFDEYEYTRIGQPKAIQGVVYSEKQINWFIELLKNTPSDMYIILAHHKPVSVMRRKTDDIPRPHYKDYPSKFVSERAPLGYEYEGNDEQQSLLIPNIIDAYLGKKKLNYSCECGDKNSRMMHFDVDFSSISPAHFLFHIGGHTHWDVCEYLPNFPTQLQLIIDEGHPRTYQFSDLERIEEESKACINEYVIDIKTQTINIRRIGAHITIGGNNRDKITFPFKRELAQ